ncbi:MAG: SsrA-binding protein SmpB [Clostridia bacterium]|nr:SsrA-binding protein SmpB [Clostridia bacterium]
MPQKGVKVVVQNRKARHDYFVLETWEAGLELKGTEVKSIRLGQCNLKDSYAAVKNGEIFVHGMHISPYEKGSYFNTDPMRPKRLLMHKQEIRKANQNVMQKGLALIPLSVYLKDGRMKLELALCKGKKLYDKRDDIAKRDAKRDIERSMREKG